MPSLPSLFAPGRPSDRRLPQVLANEGASIAYTYHSKLPESLEKLKTPLKAYKVDLRTEAPVKAFFEQVRRRRDVVSGVV